MDTIDRPAPATAARVVVAEGVWGAPLEQLARVHDVVRLDATDTSPALDDGLAGATALVVRNRTRVTRELLEAHPGLRVVARAGVGLDNIDLAAADDTGTVVLSPRGANARSVAEHALGLALAVQRHVVALDRQCRAGAWDRRPGRELLGGTWGIVGAGATGRACAEIATALGMRVVAHDPYADPADLGGLELGDLRSVAAAADVLSIHLPGGAETTGLVDDALLAVMKPTAILLNLGRGEIVDEDALVRALQEGRLAGAGLDVRATEPPVTGVLETLPTVVLTPHVAGLTEQSQQRITQVLADELSTVLGGGTATAAVGRHRELVR